MESAIDDTDDLERVAVDDQSAPDRMTVAVETGHEVVVSEHRDGAAAAGGIVSGGHHPAGRRLQAEQREKVPETSSPDATSVRPP